jgi:senataxin
VTDKALNQNNEIQIGEHLHVNLTAEGIVYRKDYSYLLKSLLGYRYFQQKVKTEIKIPEVFASPRQYSETFISLLVSEVRCNLEQNLLGMQKFISAIDVNKWKLDYSKHEGDQLVTYGIETLAVDECAFSLNMLVLVSNSETINLKDINKEEENFCILGVTTENGLCPKMNVTFSTKFEQLLKRAVKNGPLYVRKFTKITSQVREYLAVKTLEFHVMAEMLYNPERSQKEFEIRHTVDVFGKFFKTIENRFNQSQLKSIRNICLMKQGIKLLQGPPGTGKTHTLIGIVSGIYHYIKNHKDNSRKHILICAPSNYAVDEIILRLMRQGLYNELGEKVVPNIVRMGVLNKTKNPEITKVTIEYLAEQEVKSSGGMANPLKREELKMFEGRQLSDLQEQLRDLDAKLKDMKLNQIGTTSEFGDLYDYRGKLANVIINRKMERLERKEILEAAMEKVMNRAEIICCTLNSSGSEKLERYQHNIEAIIVDEAAQSTEPSNIIPLRFRANKLILIGDPKQLPATTFSDENTATKYNRSLFEVVSPLT